MNKAYDMSRMHFVQGDTDSLTWAIRGNPNRCPDQLFEEVIKDQGFFDTYKDCVFSENGQKQILHIDCINKGTIATAINTTLCQRKGTMSRLQMEKNAITGSHTKMILSKDLQRDLDGLDRCDAKLDARIAGVYPYKSKKKTEYVDDQAFFLRQAGVLPKINNKKNLVCFDEAHSGTADSQANQDQVYKLLLARFAQTDEQIEYESHIMEQQLTRLANTNNGIMKFAQFISNMRITPSKEEQAVLINRADEIKIDGKTLLEWFEIYQTDAEKYNAPLRRARSIRSQDSNRSYVTKQIQRINQPQKHLSLFPFKSKVKQYEKLIK
ncbi:MAG: hypothetical protein EZS28_016692 [Streblomastix strix]|uniref:Uncharacterized protein n=1 Tax=Streblomastix strix TaxID=222440 RepID=A0A5J4VZU5_9EUKA|nr:MAG: hypothetical protein EZS28_016692 [Streblomastix strix]